MTAGQVAGQLALDLDPGDATAASLRLSDIEAIHRATGIYTRVPEIEALLDRLGWPHQGTRLLDPGAGNGGFLVAALGRLDLARDDTATAVRRVKGYEFHPGALTEARAAVAAHLIARGWTTAVAHKTARQVVEERDYLLGPVPAGVFDVIAANPPYWRLANLPPGYRTEYELMVPAYARADLLHAYLARSAEILKPGGRVGLITSDRWLLNDGPAELRRRLGRRFRVAAARKLTAESAFHRPKNRRAGTLPRVHPVSLILVPAATGEGRELTGEPFRLGQLPDVDGVPLPALAAIRLAPWLGPDGIFLVDGATARRLPPGSVAPAVEPEDITSDDQVRPEPRRWVILTGPDQAPPPEVLAHLDSRLHLMPARGRRAAVRWVPPESFTAHLPLDRDAVLVPRIARHLRPVILPAGRVPANHQLVVVSGLPAPVIRTMLRDPAVRAQADALALGVDGGYSSYTARLLRRLVIPSGLVPPQAATVAGAR